MKETNEIRISFNRVIVFLLFLGSSFFVYIGYGMILEDILFYNFIGTVSIIFFGYGMIMTGIMLFDFSPGLIINSEGIFDNSSGIKAGMILWNEITDITLAGTTRQKFITIHVVNPDKYFNSSNIIKNIATRISNIIYGSPIHINSIALDINFDELHMMIDEKFKLYRKLNKT